MRLMAGDAGGHDRYGGRFGHYIELANIAVAHHTLHPRLKVISVGPGYARGDLINAPPRNRLLGPRVLGHLPNGRTVARHLRMTGHTDAGRRKRHLGAWIGIRMAHPALKTLSNMNLVTVWERLLGRRWRHDVRADLLPRRLRLNSAGKHE